jgi:hypothetical protein
MLARLHVCPTIVALLGFPRGHQLDYPKGRSLTLAQHLLVMLLLKLLFTSLFHTLNFI